MKSTAAVYAIRNTATNERYVGITRDADTRFKAHRSALAMGRHPCSALQAAWVAYGEDAFSFETLEQLARNADPRERETHWIGVARSEGQAYNTRLISSYGKPQKPRRISGARMRAAIERFYDKPLADVLDMLLQQRSLPYAVAAKQLGISVTTLYHWRRQIEAQRADSPAATQRAESAGH